MIVDDEPGIRLTVSTLLEKAGFEVTQIESGAKCLEALEDGYRGVILMDIMMENMDGWETVRQMESRGLMKGNIVSMLTAKENPYENMGRLTESVLGYIRKPFRTEELITYLDTYCQWLAHNRQSEPVRV